MEWPDESELPKDHTRPTFDRKPGEIGLFIDVYDAIPLDKQKYGSRQFFLMDLVDRFYQEGCLRCEIYKIKGFFEKRNVLTDITLEYFHPGVLLIIHCNSAAAVEPFVASYKSGKLERYFVECFVTTQLQAKLQLTGLKLKIKLYDDEVEKVIAEWQSKELPVRFNIEKSAKDFRMITVIRRYQQKRLSESVAKLKDLEYKYEVSVPEFLVFLKQFGPNKPSPVKTISEAQALCEKMSTNPEAQSQIHLFREYLQMIQELQKIARDIETNIVFPFIQIRTGCESDNQLKVKRFIRETTAHLKSALKENAFFNMKPPQNWAERVPTNQRPYYEGMIILVPAVMSGIIDIDQAIDEYYQVGDLMQKLAGSKLLG